MTMLRRTQGGLQSQPDSQSMAEDACRTLRQESKPDHRSAAASDEKRRAQVIWQCSCSPSYSVKRLDVSEPTETEGKRGEWSRGGQKVWLVMAIRHADTLFCICYSGVHHTWHFRSHVDFRRSSATNLPLNPSPSQQALCVSRSATSAPSMSIPAMVRCLSGMMQSASASARRNVTKTSR